MTESASGAGDWLDGHCVDVARRHRGVVLRLYRMTDRDVLLVELTVDKADRGRRVGSEVLTGLGQAADVHGDTVVCIPRTERGHDVRHLRSWLRRFGFVGNTGRARQYDIPDSMYRLPGARVVQPRVIEPPSDVAPVLDAEGRRVAMLPAEAAHPEITTCRVLAMLMDLGLPVRLDRGHWLTRGSARLVFGESGSQHVGGDLLIDTKLGRLRRGMLKLPWRREATPLTTTAQWRRELDAHGAAIRRHLAVVREVRSSQSGALAAGNSEKF